MDGPDLPVVQPARLPKDGTAVLVLDVNAECEDPKAKGYELLNRLGVFLQRVRKSQIPIIYTISLTRRGTALGKVAAPLAHRDDEPILYPDAFDKFTGGELRDLLNQRGIQNLVIVGRSTNVAVMYTTTSAVRVHKYKVVLPMDGVNANSDYEHHYALHQLNGLPKKVTVPITFTTLDKILFDEH
jgi:nicotinamidase-related amidase